MPRGDPVRWLVNVLNEYEEKMNRVESTVMKAITGRSRRRSFRPFQSFNRTLQSTRRFDRKCDKTVRTLARKFKDTFRSASFTVDEEVLRGRPEPETSDEQPINPAHQPYFERYSRTKSKQEDGEEDLLYNWPAPHVQYHTAPDSQNETAHVSFSGLRTLVNEQMVAMERRVTQQLSPLHDTVRSIEDAVNGLYDDPRGSLTSLMENAVAFVTNHGPFGEDTLRLVESYKDTIQRVKEQTNGQRSHDFDYFDEVQETQQTEFSDPDANIDGMTNQEGLADSVNKRYARERSNLYTGDDTVAVRPVTELANGTMEQPNEEDLPSHSLYRGYNPGKKYDDMHDDVHGAAQDQVKERADRLERTWRLLLNAEYGSEDFAQRVANEMHPSGPIKVTDRTITRYMNELTGSPTRRRWAREKGAIASDRTSPDDTYDNPLANASAPEDLIYGDAPLAPSRNTEE